MGKEKWEEACDCAFEDFKVIQPKWKNLNHYQKMIRAGHFYQLVFANGHNPSGLVSKEALHLPTKKRTIDHWLPARLILRAAMEYYPELFHNKDEFRYIFREVCQNTIALTEYQNGIVKFKNSEEEGIRIKYLSIKKYEICEDKEACNGKGRTGIIFFNTAKGSYSENKYEFINGFPLKKLIPEWITEFEKQFLIEKK